MKLHYHRIGDGYDGVIKGGLNMSNASGDILFLFFLFSAPASNFSHDTSLSFLPFTYHRATRTFTSTGVSVGALTSNR